MDGAVRKNEQNRVHPVSTNGLHKFGELLDNRSKVRWARQLDHLERLLICSDDVADALNLWVVCLKVDWEAVACAHCSGVSAKTEDWERFIVVVRLDDAAHIEESLLVLVRLVAEIVERARTAWVTITTCVVDSGNETNLPASTQVVYKCGWNKDLELVEGKLGAILAIEGRLPIAKLVERCLEVVEDVIRAVHAHADNKTNARV